MQDIKKTIIHKLESKLETYRISEKDYLRDFKENEIEITRVNGLYDGISANKLITVKDNGDFIQFEPSISKSTLEFGSSQDKEKYEETKRITRKLNSNIISLQNDILPSITKIENIIDEIQTGKVKFTKNSIIDTLSKKTTEIFLTKYKNYQNQLNDLVKKDLLEGKKIIEDGRISRTLKEELDEDTYNDFHQISKYNLELRDNRNRFIDYVSEGAKTTWDRKLGEGAVEIILGNEDLTVENINQYLQSKSDDVYKEVEELYVRSFYENMKQPNLKTGIKLPEPV